MKYNINRTRNIAYIIIKKYIMYYLLLRNNISSLHEPNVLVPDILQSGSIQYVYINS